MNYAFLLRGQTARERSLRRWVLLGGAYNPTITVFVHTLKIKRIIGPATAVAAYVSRFVIWAIPASLLAGGMVAERPALTALSTLGLAVNFASKTKQDAFQIVLAAEFGGYHGSKAGRPPTPLEGGRKAKSSYCSRHRGLFPRLNFQHPPSPLPGQNSSCRPTQW